MKIQNSSEGTVLQSLSPTTFNHTYSKPADPYLTTHTKNFQVGVLRQVSQSVDTPQLNWHKLIVQNSAYTNLNSQYTKVLIIT